MLSDMLFSCLWSCSLAIIASTGRVGLCFCGFMYRRRNACLWPCSLAVPVLAGWVYGFVAGALEGSGSGFKASQKTGLRLKVSSDRLGEAGNRTCDPWFTRHRFIPYTKADT